MLAKTIKLIVAALFSLLLAFGVLMFFKGQRSQKMTPNVGIENDQLKACGNKPNCISSFAEQGSDFYYPPIETNNIEVVWDNLNLLLDEMDYKIEKSEQRYIHAAAQTKIMGFVDDLEFLLDETQGKIYVRSESRVGYSDMGKNRKRMDKILKKLLK